MKGPVSLSRSWLVERYDLDPLLQRLRDIRIAGRGRLMVWHLAGLAFFLALVELASGILLSLYFNPSVTRAHESVRFIIAQVDFGDLVRSVHAWGSDLLLVTMGALMVGALLQRLHRRPNELPWMLGVLLSVAVLGLAFSGSLLPWSEQSLVSSRVATDLVDQIPLVGHWLRRALLGGEEQGAVTMVRIYGVHIGILPALTSGLVLVLVLHVLARRHAEPTSVQGDPVRLVPDLVLRTLAVWTLAFMALVVLAVLWPPRLGVAANDLMPAPTGVHPPWYLLFVHRLLQLLPARLLGLPASRVVVSAGVVALLAVLGLPVLDRRGSRALAGFVVVVALLLLGVTGHALLG